MNIKYNKERTKSIKIVKAIADHQGFRSFPSAVKIDCETFDDSTRFS